MNLRIRKKKSSCQYSKLLNDRQAAKPKYSRKKAKGTAGEFAPKEMFTLQCPNCDAECHAKVIDLHHKNYEVTPAGDVLEFPRGYIALRCRQCNLWLLLGLDEDGNPYQSLDEMREIFHQLDEIDLEGDTN